MGMRKYRVSMSNAEGTLSVSQFEVATQHVRVQSNVRSKVKVYMSAIRRQLVVFPLLIYLMLYNFKMRW